MEGISKNIKKIKSDMRIKVSRRMVASAGGVLRKEAKLLAKRHGFNQSGALIRNIAIKRETKSPSGTEQYNLGVRHGKNLTKKNKAGKFLALNRNSRVVTRFVNDPFYWWFLERGHKVVTRSTQGLTQKARRGNATRFVKGKSFIEQAFKNKRRQAVAAMSDQLQKEIEKANK